MQSARMRSPSIRWRCKRGRLILRKPHGDLGDAPIVALLEQLEQSYDDEFGGFGEAPKFPQPEIHEFLLAEWRLWGTTRLYDMTARTMLAMSRGGMYDHVEGGFFRYSTTRDWSVPHFEKMAEDHAGLLRVFAELALFAPTKEFHATLVSALGYVARRCCATQANGFFAGSQDADEEYYALPLEERSARGEPYVDRTSYTNWTCALAGAQCLCARALDDDALLTQALQTLDNVNRILVGDDGLLFHVLVPGGTPEIRGLLVDHVAYLRALLDAHEISGEPRFLERAESIAAAIATNFSDADGAFDDRVPDGEALGRLSVRERPIVENGLLAEALLRLAALTENAGYRERAAAVLRYFAPVSRAAGPFAATYARALRRYLLPELSVRIVGDPATTDEFREVARRLPEPLYGDSHTLAARGLQAGDAGRTGRLRLRDRHLRRARSRSERAARRLRCARFGRYFYARTKLSQYQEPHSPTAHEYAISAYPQRGKRSRTASIMRATRNGSKSRACRMPNCAKPLT